jgi:outer membrane lipoprotein-sorting protein
MPRENYSLRGMALRPAIPDTVRRRLRKGDPAMRRCHVLGLALTFSAAFALADDAAQILKSTEETYRNLKSYAFEGTTTSETKVGASTSKSETSFVVAFKEPNEFRLEYDYPAAGRWVRVSDGKRLWNHRSMTKESNESAVTEDDIRMLSGSPIAVFSDIGEDVTKASIVGSEQVSIGGQSFDCHVVQFERPNRTAAGPGQPLPVKLWIDKTRHLVLRQVSGLEARGSGSSTENTRTVMFTRADVNQSLPDDLFHLKK